MIKALDRKSRRGVALMLVLIVIALASVLGYAMLSSAALRTQIGHNAEITSQAETLAESGVNLAQYYLQYPEYAPGGPFTATGTYWTGTGGPIAFTSGVSGTIDVTVTRDASDKWTYDIVSVGRSVGDGSTPIARTARSRVYLATKYEIKHGAVFQNDLTVPTALVIDGSLFAQRSAVLKNNGNVKGPGYRKINSFSLGTPQGSWQSFPFKPLVIPTTLSDIRSYRTYAYVNDGSTDTAGSISASTLGSDLNPTVSNRAGIYYAEGDLEINNTVDIEGTLIVRGNLVINSNDVRVEPKPGYPGLIVDGSIDIRRLAPKLEVRGLCWVRDRVFATALSSPELIVDGGLMVCGTNPLFNGTTLAKPKITYNADKVNIPDLCDVGRTITGVKVLRYSSAQ